MQNFLSEEQQSCLSVQRKSFHYYSNIYPELSQIVLLNIPILYEDLENISLDKGAILSIGNYQVVVNPVFRI